jgi:hypothetical protein
MHQIPFIDICKSALHVFGQQIRPSSEALLTAYTAFGAMH